MLDYGQKSGTGLEKVYVMISSLDFDDVQSWLFVTDVFDLDDQRPFALTPAQRVVDMCGIEIGVAPLLWQAHVGFNIAEFVDFTLGLFLLDVFGDDHVERPPTLPFVPEGR